MAIEALKSAGKEAYLVNENTIRICHPQSTYYPIKSKEITKPEQLEVKEYQIIA
jgi:hypothetical protein